MTRLSSRIRVFVRPSCALLVLVLASCTHHGEASLVVETRPDAFTEEGTLRETIGIETLGGVSTPILAKGCSAPCRASHTFSTAEDGQDQILLRLFRGEAKSATTAQPLGTFQVSGIAPVSRGRARILVEFEADRGGITIKARDMHGRSALSVRRVAP